jgi:hypothetical protein
MLLLGRGAYVGAVILLVEKTSMVALEIPRRTYLTRYRGRSADLGKDYENAPSLSACKEMKLGDVHTVSRPLTAKEAG